MPLKAATVIFAHALVGWGLCGATMGLGLAFTTLPTALALHLLAAPLFFVAITWLYVRRFAYTTPLQTAAAFTAIIVLLDVFVVALLINRSFAMFTSVPGTWLPFLLIFLATYLTGRWMAKPPA